MFDDLLGAGVFLGMCHGSWQAHPCAALCFYCWVKQWSGGSCLIQEVKQPSLFTSLHWHWTSASHHGMVWIGRGLHCFVFFVFNYFVISVIMLFLCWYFCCECGLNPSHFAGFFLCFIKDSVAWTHLKFFPPKLVFKFPRNQMINVLRAWTSPWLIVGFCRHREGDEVEGNWNGSCGTAPCSQAEQEKGRDVIHTIHRECQGQGWTLTGVNFISVSELLHFQRICGHTASHSGNVHMDCIPSRALVTGNPCSGLLFTNVTQAKSAQGALLWCLGWVSAASWFHCALLPCKKRQDALSHGAFHCGTKPSLRGTMQFKCFMAITLCLS